MNKKTFTNPVFLISALIIFGLVVVGAIMPQRFGYVAELLFNFTTTHFAWFYLLAVFIFVVFLISISISKYGKIRLGPKNSRPEYPFFTWIGMLFSTGFGSGLVFYGDRKSTRLNSSHV